MKTNQNNERQFQPRNKSKQHAGKVPVIFGIGSLGH